MKSTVDDHKIALETPLIDDLGDKGRRGRCSGLEEGKAKPCRSQKSIVTRDRCTSPPQLVSATDRKISAPLTLSASLLPIINKHVVAALFFPDPLFDMIITPAQRVRIGNDQRLSFAGGNIYQYCQYLCLYRMIKRLFVTSDVIAVLYRTTTDTPHFRFFFLIPCQSQSAEVDRCDRVG